LGKKAVIVGIGIAGSVHARVLEDFPGVTVVAGVDTSLRTLDFRGSKTPVYSSVFDITSQSQLDPDMIVIATPTPTHAAVCGEVAEYFGQASIIVEKPAADNLEDALRVVRGIGGKQPVSVAYHMAFSPVVEWGVREASERAGQLGAPVAIEAWAADPYQSDLVSAQERLGNSWIDSGINALSVIERFVRPVACTSLRRIGSESRSVFEGTFICESDSDQLTATVMTSWSSTAPSRWTRIRYSSGAELVMDHNAVAGYIRQNGQATATFGSDGTIPRREAHYRSLYRSLLATEDQVFSADASMRLHELLLGREYETRN
jgi:predicted dehydrogenase